MSNRITYSNGIFYVNFRSETFNLHLPVSAVGADAVLGLLKDHALQCNVHLPAKFTPGEQQMKLMQESYAEFDSTLAFDLK